MARTWCAGCTASSSDRADARRPKGLPSARRTAVRIAIVGYGRMGHAVEAAALARGHQIAARVDLGDALTPDRLAGADVAVEFTAPAAAAGNIARLVEAGMPVVTGTTGWHAELPRLAALVTAR